MMEKKGSLLEVDKTIISRNLQFEDIDNEPLDKLFPEQEISKKTVFSRLVLPSAGFCFKTLSCGAPERKAFINVCHTDAIPAPVDITRKELLDFWSNQMEGKSQELYRIPMSFGAPREELDKKGVACDVYDVAINPTFYKKVKEDMNFCSFLLHVSFKGIFNKFGVKLSISNGTILKNRKAMGSIQPQNVQIRLPNKNLVEPVGNLDTPDYALRLIGGNLIAKFYIPNVAATDVKLKVGEDRIIVIAALKYIADLFVPFSMNSDLAEAFFDCQTDVLQVTVPVSDSGVQ